MRTQEEIDQVYKQLYLSLDDSPHYHTWVRGYTQCQEDMANKKYTFNQIIDAMAMAREINGKETYYKYSMEEIINLLNKQD